MTIAATDMWAALWQWTGQTDAPWFLHWDVVLRSRHSVITWVRSGWKRNDSVSSVSLAHNKQGQGVGKDLMACCELRLKAARSTERRRLDCHAYLVFYLQTCSIILPRSMSLGERGGLLHAFGLLLRKSVAYSSRRGVLSIRHYESPLWSKEILIHC